MRSLGERSTKTTASKDEKSGILCAVDGIRTRTWLREWMGRSQIPREVRRLAERLQRCSGDATNAESVVMDQIPSDRMGKEQATSCSTTLPLKDRAQGRWSGILPALGIGESFLTGKHGPCPLCGGKDRWRWDNLEGRGTWICSKCGAGDGISLVMQKNGWEFREAAKQIEAVIGSAPADTPKRERSDRDKRDAMNKLWRMSKTVEADDPVGRYLCSSYWPDILPSLACAPPTICVIQSDCPSFHPAMIAMVTGPDGAPLTLHRTYLTDDGNKAPVIEPRR